MIEDFEGTQLGARDTTVMTTFVDVQHFCIMQRLKETKKKEDGKHAEQQQNSRGSSSARARGGRLESYDEKDGRLEGYVRTHPYHG